MAREDLHFRLRIPEDLKNRVEVAADENHRSMTAEIVARLEWSFAFEDRYGQGPGLIEHISLEKQNAELLSFVGDQESELRALKWKADHPVEEMRKTIEDQMRLLGRFEARITALEQVITLAVTELAKSVAGRTNSAGEKDAK